MPWPPLLLCTNRGYMHFSVNVQSIATAELNFYLEQQAQAIAPERRVIRTPQRKANYNDKARLRRVELKRIAYADYNCTSIEQIKNYLRFLGIRLDLRLTAAWDALVFELRQEILAVKAIAEASKPQPQQVLLAAMKEAIALGSWNSVKALLPTHSEYKREAWNQLSAAEKQRLNALVPEPVRILTKAQRNGAIVSFKEDPEGDIYWVWRTSDAQPELVTSCFAKTFVRNLVAPSLLDTAIA